MNKIVVIISLLLSQLFLLSSCSCSDQKAYDIKVTDSFDKELEEVFKSNGNEVKIITPDDILRLFDEKSPYYMESICKNLGIESWDGSDPLYMQISDKNINNVKYKLVEIRNNFDLRLLFYREDSNKNHKFIDFIDFGGRTAGTEFSIEKYGGKDFVRGKSNKGYGTGEAIYFEDWYLLTDEGKKLVLSFPYSEHSVDHYRGYTIAANDVRLNSEANNIIVDYSFKNMYYIDIDNADQDGMINVEGEKKVVFTWDDKKSSFTSECIDEAGKAEVLPESNDVTKKCTAILKDNYRDITESAKELSEEENKYIVNSKKASIEHFLEDCENCKEKAEIQKILKEIK